MRLITRPLSYTLACLALLLTLLLLYPEPWLYFGWPLGVDLQSGLLAIGSKLSWLVMLLLLALGLSLCRINQLKLQIAKAAKLRISTYQDIEAAVYEGSPFIESDLDPSEIKPIKDALYWQQQQQKALSEKLTVLQQQKQRENKKLSLLEQEKRHLKLNMLELKEKNQQLTQQITHLNQFFPKQLQELAEEFEQYKSKQSQLVQPLVDGIVQVIDELSYLQWRPATANQAAVLRSLQHDLEREYQRLLDTVGLEKERPATLANKILPLGPHVLSVDASAWSLVWFSHDQDSSQLESMIEWGISVSVASDATQIGGVLSKIKNNVILVDLGTQAGALPQLESEFGADALIVLVDKHWSEAQIQQYSAVADGVLVSPFLRQDLLRILSGMARGDISDSVHQLELMLQGQLPSEVVEPLLAPQEVMVKQQVMDDKKQLSPKVTEALFDLASLAEQVADGQMVNENASKIIILSERLALPVLAVIARELAQQCKAKQDVTALCFLLWHCYQDSVRAFNARTEF
ncbi:hypothetical protein Q4519_02625 [Motilimonas sp. 1_MG-2023]|uniref:hypothetical protein n=1 Tax=Motilimonas sp. 1_MG-2023 TaxID=3062672 RepID=UPI0026E4003F|nr:hypothetical protein [Motilimonas sp. 1_MG-2023]MDO6524569.1 hypothetical protein [Motilimonas sp. 1_MG-2023]